MFADFQMRAWAVYLSLADLNSLLLRADGGGKRFLDDGTALFSWISSRLKDNRTAVRIQAVEAWEMFTKSMLAQCSLDPAQVGYRDSKIT